MGFGICAAMLLLQPAWHWSDDEVKISYSIARVKAPYSAVIESKNGFKLAISKAGKAVLKVDVADYQGFLIKGDALYLLNYHLMSNGCAVEKYDLKSGAKAWIAPLQGIGSIAHSKYFNSVIITDEKGVITIYGKESAGRYRETIDAKTGKTLSNYKFPR